MCSTVLTTLGGSGAISADGSRERLRILHINDTYGRGGGGGTEQSVPNTCALLEARGHITAVLYGRDTGLDPSDRTRPVAHIPGLCQFQLRLDPAIMQQALAWIGRFAPDVVHLHQVNNAHLVQAIVRHWPTVFFVHNHLLNCPSGIRYWRTTGTVCPHTGPGAHCVFNAYLRHCNVRRPGHVVRSLLSCASSRRFARLVTHLAVDSTYMRDMLVTAGIPRDAITILPTVTELPDEHVLRPYPRDPMVLFVGRLSEEKGVHCLLQAIPYLRTPCRLVIAGDGYYRPALERLARQLNLSNVEFAGWVLKPDLAAYYGAASVVVVPSVYPEPLGLVGPEAMAHARPVVAFPLGGIPDWLRHGETGLAARPGDPVDLARQIDTLLQQPALAAAMGQAGRRLVEQEFHPQRYVDRLERVYALVRQQWEARRTRAVAAPERTVV